MEIKIYSVLAPQWMNIKSLLKKFGVEFIHEKTFRDLGSGFVVKTKDMSKNGC